jgi:catechol 2,3-dioxygenase-like lactoylglutathione lyase family enzyme
MQLGAFSVSLAVKDIQASRRFYEKLGFTSAMGDMAANWTILQPRLGLNAAQTTLAAIAQLMNASLRE